MDCVVKSISEMRPNFILSKSMNNIGCVHEIRNEYEQKELYVRCTQNYQQKFKAQFKLTRSIDHIVEMRSWDLTKIYTPTISVLMKEETNLEKKVQNGLEIAKHSLELFILFLFLSPHYFQSDVFSFFLSYFLAILLWYYNICPYTNHMMLGSFKFNPLKVLILSNTSRC
jgi:hypothetical protein